MNTASRRLRAGIVGGGRGSFIGSVHRMAAQLDGDTAFVAGAMSSDPQTALECAAAWNLDRGYVSFAEMAVAEAARTDGIDFVIIATPNHMHFPVAKAFLEAGIHVVCDKPLAFSVAEGQALAVLVEQGAPLFAVSYTYTGYPMVREARNLLRGGKLGRLRKVLVEYNQSWLADDVERQGSKQAAWRTDPSKAGLSGCVGDIGTHAENLLHFVTGERISALCADLTAFVPGRELDDDANILIRLEGGSKGTLVCSQIASGEENNLSLRVYGEKAGLEWRQQEPNSLTYKPLGGPIQVLRAGSPYLGAPAQAASLIPAGHPEGYIEAFAAFYRDFKADIRRIHAGERALLNYPSVQDGLRGLRFIETAVKSSGDGGQWMSL